MWEPNPTTFSLISFRNPLVMANAQIITHTPNPTLTVAIHRIGFENRLPLRGSSLCAMYRLVFNGGQD